MRSASSFSGRRIRASTSRSTGPVRDGSRRFSRGLATETAMSWDILIRRSTILDGRGSPGTVADIALAAGRIAALGPSLDGVANKVIDATGLTVTPGFIDIKTHSDFVLPLENRAPTKAELGKMIALLEDGLRA